MIEDTTCTCGFYDPDWCEVHSPEHKVLFYLPDLFVTNMTGDELLVAIQPDEASRQEALEWIRKTS